jgi:hypothetical protein
MTRRNFYFARDKLFDWKLHVMNRGCVDCPKFRCGLEGVEWKRSDTILDVIVDEKLFEKGQAAFDDF